jgi:hypothetical protein
MFMFLRAIGLRPIERSEAITWTGTASPYITQVLETAFDRTQAVIVLMTPDEIAYLRTDYGAGPSDPETQAAAQARPNVLFEAGMAMGRDPRRTVLVELGDLRPFGDVAGLHAVRMSNDASKRNDLAQRLRGAGCTIDLCGNDWLSAGDFTPPPPLTSDGPLLGEHMPSTGHRGVSLDMRYHRRNSGSDRLEIINQGSESIFDMDLKLPSNSDLFIQTNDLPLKQLPARESIHLRTTKSAGSKDRFYVTITGRTAGGTAVCEELFVDTLG